MIPLNVVYMKNKAVLEDIYGHLVRCNEYFIPPLSKRVNIDDYSNKIFQRAVTFETWHANRLVGLIAVYFSDAPQCSAFISNVSVENEYMRTGISSKLLVNCMFEAKDRGCAYIKLDVDDQNISALNLYKKFNFIVTNNDRGVIQMTLSLR